MMKTADYAAPALEGKMGLEDPIQILIFIVDISALIKKQLLLSFGISDFC